MIRRPPRSTLFPNPPLFRSRGRAEHADRRAVELGRRKVAAGDRMERRDVRLVVVAKRGSVDRKSTRLNSSHANISYAAFCLKKNHLLCCFLTLSDHPTD